MQIVYSEPSCRMRNYFLDGLHLLRPYRDDPLLRNHCTSVLRCHNGSIWVVQFITLRLDIFSNCFSIPGLRCWGICLLLLGLDLLLLPIYASFACVNWIRASYYPNQSGCGYVGTCRPAQAVRIWEEAPKPAKLARVSFYLVRRPHKRCYRLRSCPANQYEFCRSRLDSHDMSRTRPPINSHIR